MIDVALLKRPIDELAAVLGTGHNPAANPLPELTAAATTLSEVSAAGTAATNQLASTWQGDAATAALLKGREFAGAADQYGLQGQQMGLSWLAAAESVLRGVGELATIGASFMRILQHAETLLAHPLGQLTLLKEALDHLSRALGVVIRISGELSANAQSLDGIGRGVTLPEAPGVAGLAAGAASISPATNTPADVGAFGSSDPGSSLAAAGTGVAVQLPDGSITHAPTPQAADAVRNALSQRGVPYVWGGTTPGAGFDCSGLTQWSYSQAGVEIPRLAQEQNVGTPVSRDNVMAGDLVVWDGHVAMVIGNGQMVEAGNPVSVTPIRTDNMGQAFYGFYRPTT